MTLQHSPGPFAYLTHEDDYIILDAEGNCIADLMRSRHHGDGHLFAAAPEMLRLLRVLCDGLDEYWESQNMAVVVEARELIARLDGDT